MSFLTTFALIVGVAPRDAEDALRSERAAHTSLSRRQLLAGGAALASGAAFSFATPVKLGWSLDAMRLAFDSANFFGDDRNIFIDDSLLPAQVSGVQSWRLLHRAR